MDGWIEVVAKRKQCLLDLLRLVTFRDKTCDAIIQHVLEEYTHLL